MKYTPGPWLWDIDNYHGGYTGIVNADGKDVLYPNCASNGIEGEAWFEDSPSMADGNLILAAPDMYEALKEVIKTLGTPCYTTKQLSDTITLAQQAVNRAEGRR